MKMSPSVNRSLPPDFHRLAADTFEEMCCALYQKEDGISVAELYRKKYQKQFGIDIKAEKSHGSGIEVASCKCYSDVRKGKIPQWSEEFLEHWETYWNRRNVKKFVLIVGCDVTAAEREAEIDLEKIKFREIGLEYEVWGPRTLQSKIRKDAGLVSQFLGPEWVQRLCGITPLVTSSSSADTGVISASILAQIASLQRSLSGEVEKKLDNAFEDILRGHLYEVAEQLLRMRASHDWIQLLPDVQARVVRLQASICLQQGDIDRAEVFANEADNICKPNEFLLRALIACRQKGPQAGLERLGTPQTRDGAHLRAGMLLEAGETDEAIRYLKTSILLVGEDAETERLKTLAALFEGDREKAYVNIQLAERLKPDWSAIQRLGGIVRYAMALSPMVGAEYYLYPNPIDIELVRDDAEGRNLLSQALSRFDRLSALPDNKEMQGIDKLWGLACISNLRDRLDEAEKRCIETLKEDPTNPSAIDWALARGFELDRHQHEGLLHELLKVGGGGAHHVVSLSRLHTIEGNEEEATEVLKLYVDRFNTPSLHETQNQLIHGLAIRQNKASSRTCYGHLNVGHRMAVLIEEANDIKDWQAVEELFGQLITLERPPAITLRAAQILASANVWKNIAQNLDGVLRFGTSEAVRIAVYAAYNSGQYKLALEILAKHRRVFPFGLPHELRQLEITALAMTGDQAIALRRADALAAETSDLSDRLLKANLQIRTGNIGGSLAVIREAARQKKLSPDSALQLSRVVVLEDKDLARMLWRQSIEKGVPKELSMSAFNLARQLDLETEATPLYQMLGQLAQEDSSTVRIVQVEELFELQRQWQDGARQLRNLYLNGAVPVHFYVAQVNTNLAEIFKLAKVTEPAPNNDGLLIRHGGRPTNIRVKLHITEWNIHLDITALLLAAQLELLDVLENLPNPLKISAFIPTALFDLESKLQQIDVAQQDEKLRNWLAQLRKRIAQGIENGRYITLPVAQAKPGDDEGTDGVSSDPVVTCLCDLLNVPKTPGVVLWLEDRNLSGYQHSQGNPLIGVLEVLRALRQAKLIADVDEYRFLLQLRHSNAQFIPLTAKEILYHLNHASIEDGRVVETSALASIRRNFACGSLMEDCLNIGESDPHLQGRPQEIEFLVHMQRIVPNCIIALWSGATFSDEESYPRASWLWSSLRIERYFRIPLGASEPDLSCVVLALTISCLLTGIVQLAGRNDSLSRLQSYVRWLKREILDYRLEKDNRLKDMLVSHLSVLMIQVVSDAAKLRKKDLGNCRFLMRAVVQQLPEDLRQRLIADSRFCSQLGIKTTDTVNAGGVSFPADAFWKATVRALTAGQAHVKDVKGQQQVKLTRVANQTDAVRLSGLKVVLHDPAFGLLYGSSTQRRKVLSANTQWLDMPVQERAKVIDHIVSIKSPAERIEAVRRVRDNSPTFLYASLERRLASEEALRLDAFLPPHATNLISHLRIATDPVTPFHDRLKDAAQALISEGGWEFAFSRLAGLPVPLPDPVQTAFLALNERQREVAAETLIASCTTPLQLLHALYLFNLGIEKDGRKYFDRLFDLALQRWRDIGRLFVEVLRWSDVAYQNDDSYVTLEASDRLALVWTHADRISNILIRGQIDCGFIANLFAENHPQRPIEQTMIPHLRYEAAPSNPRAIDETALIFFGIGYVCRGMLAEDSLLPEQLQKLVDLILVEVENTKCISPWLYLYRDVKSDPLSSIFRCWPTGTFEDGNGPAEDVVNTLLGKAIEELVAEPVSVPNWRYMRVYSMVTLSNERVNKVNEALQMVRLVRLVESEENLDFLPIIAICATRFGHQDLKEYITEQLCEVAEHLSKKFPILTFSCNPKDEPGLSQLWQLVESAAALSQHENLEEALKHFGEVMVRFAFAWPSAIAIIREVVDNTIRKVPTASAKYLWKSFQTIRSM